MPSHDFVEVLVVLDVINDVFRVRPLGVPNGCLELFPDGLPLLGVKVGVVFGMEPVLLHSLAVWRPPWGRGALPPVRFPDDLNGFIEGGG